MPKSNIVHLKLLEKIVQEEKTYKTWSKALDVLFKEQDRQQG